MADYDKLLQVPRGTKARLETIKLNLLVNTIVYATDTKELGVKLSNGNIEYFKNATDIDARLSGIIDDVDNDVSQLDGRVDNLRDYVLNIESNVIQIDGRVNSVESVKQDKLTAGDNITIDTNNKISVSGIEYELTKGKIETALAGSGLHSTQLGPGASTSGDYSIVLGRNAKAEGNYSTAVGREASASGTSSTAIGRDADASGESSTALGQSAKAEHHGSTALGQNARTEGHSSVALGRSTHAVGSFSTAIGYLARAEGRNSIAIGTQTEVTEDDVADFGSNTQVRVNETPLHDRDAVSKKYLESVIGEGSVVTLEDAQTITGAKTFSNQLRITDVGYATGLLIEGNGYITDASRSVRANILRARVTNDNGKTSDMFTIGTYGIEDLGEVPNPYYMYLDSKRDGDYDNATLKVDARNRVGVALNSILRPTEALDVGGKIRMRTQTVAEDDDDIAVTKGYMDAAINTLNHDIVLIADTAFTISQAHFNKTLIITSPTDVTITVPTQIVENIEKGFFCDIIRYGTGEVTFSGAGIVLNSAGALSIDAQYMAASLTKIDNNNEWLLIGGIETGLNVIGGSDVGDIKSALDAILGV